jgi:hypothetical protein
MATSRLFSRPIRSAIHSQARHFDYSKGEVVQPSKLTALCSYLFKLLAVAVMCLAFAIGLSAQAAPAAETHGFTVFEEFRGSTSDQGQFTVLDSSIGYDFNGHVGLDVGVPYYFYRATPNLIPSERHSWNDRLGDPYADLRLTFENRVLNYATVITVAVPVAETGAFSTGRLGVNWFNHFDRPIGRLTPFVNVGISNGLLDTRLISQPFQIFDSFRSLGFLADGEGGMTLRMANRLVVGGSYYTLQPSGSQKVFAANGIQNFLLPNGTGSSGSDLTHDHGYSAFIRFNPTRFMYIEPAYVHSLKFNQDAATLTVGFDLRALLGGRH